MSQLDGRARSVADEIAHYLDRRPDASDTEEGVMRWWIPRIRLEEERGVVRSALALLVSQGVVERVVLPGGLVMFRLHRRHPATGSIPVVPAQP
jgi:hypothetical protein